MILLGTELSLLKHDFGLHIAPCYSELTLKIRAGDEDDEEYAGEDPEQARKASEVRGKAKKDKAQATNTALDEDHVSDCPGCDISASFRTRRQTIHRLDYMRAT